MSCDLEKLVLFGGGQGHTQPHSQPSMLKVEMEQNLLIYSWMSMTQICHIYHFISLTKRINFFVLFTSLISNLQHKLNHYQLIPTIPSEIAIS